MTHTHTHKHTHSLTHSPSGREIFPVDPSAVQWDAYFEEMCVGLLKVWP